MTENERQATLDSIMMRASDTLGDITPDTLSIFYHRYPDAKSLFEYWGGIRRDRLETEMIAQGLYCLMYFYDRPVEISIILRDTVPYHRLVLNVPPETFLGLIVALGEVIFDTIPASAKNEIQLWEDLQAKIREMVDLGAKDDWTYRSSERTC